MEAGTESLPGGGPSPAPVLYKKYTASNLAVGQSVGASASIASNKPPKLALILLALAGLAALFLVVVRLRVSALQPRATTRLRRVPSTPVQRKGPKPKQPSASERHSEGEVGSDLLIAEIAALDVSFDQGLIKEEDYRKLRAARKAQLLEARQEEEADG